MSTDISDNEEEDMLSANEIDYESIFEDKAVLNEIIFDENIWKRANKGLALEKLSKILKIEQEDVENNKHHYSMLNYIGYS